MAIEQGVPNGSHRAPRAPAILVRSHPSMLDGRFGAPSCHSTRYDARGGPLSMVKWRVFSLARKDHVHLTTHGYELLAEHFAKGLLQGYGERAAP